MTPFMTRIGSPGAQWDSGGRRVPDALHRPGSPTLCRTYPGDPIRVMKGVIISAPRY